MESKEKTAQSWACREKGSVSLEHLKIDASYTYLKYRTGIHFKGLPLYGWRLDIENSRHLGQIDFSFQRHFWNFHFDVSSLPFVQAGIGLSMPDSLAYASASMGYGEFFLGRLAWKLDDSNAYVNRLEADWNTRFLSKKFSIGSSFDHRKVESQLIYAKGRPDQETHLGQELSDSVEFWMASLLYSHRWPWGELSFTFRHLWGSLVIEGLHYEKIEEDLIDKKRFLYLPVDFYASMASLDLQVDAASFKLAYARLDLHLPYISWKEGRFYPTVAPNQALENSFIKMLSVNVYNSNFRIYGDGSIPVFLSGAKYEWDLKYKWDLRPSAGLHLFFVDAYLDVGINNEAKSMWTMNVKKDTLNWNLLSIGGIISAGWKMESPQKQFYAELSLLQVIPVYLREEHLDAFDEEPENENSTMFFSKQILLKKSSNENYMYPSVKEDDDDQSYRIFKNGFALALSLGIRF